MTPLTTNADIHPWNSRKGKIERFVKYAYKETPDKIIHMANSTKIRLTIELGTTPQTRRMYRTKLAR